MGEFSHVMVLKMWPYCTGSPLIQLPMCIPRKKWEGVKSGERLFQAIGPPLIIHPSETILYKYPLTLIGRCIEAPFD